MQVSTSKAVAKFEAFDLKIRVESKEEAQALYAIFNYTHNTSLLPGGVAKEILRIIGDEYYISDDEYDKVIANGITYKEFYR